MGVSDDDPVLGVTVVLVVELDLAVWLVGTSGWVGCSVLGVVVAVTGGVAGVVAGVVEELGAPTEVPLPVSALCASIEGCPLLCIISMSSLASASRAATAAARLEFLLRVEAFFAAF